MRQYLFHGKRTDNGEWVYGSPIFQDGYVLIRFWNSEEFEYEEYLVAPESVGQYTGMNEFVLIDESRNAPLFEGDIVEVWGWRSVYGRNQSQYDKMVKVRGVIYFGGRGQWLINYDNKYNEKLAQLKGSETDKRSAKGAWDLYYYGYSGDNIEGYRTRQLEWHGKFHDIKDIVSNNDIVKIGTVYDNADLLEG